MVFYSVRFHRYPILLGDKLREQTSTAPTDQPEDSQQGWSQPQGNMQLVM